MIAKEAIETLKANYPDACYEQLREAVDAAIEALKAQGVAGDTIYRQTAIDAMYKILHDYFWANDEELDAIIATLNDLPSAQPDNRLSKIADLVEGTIDHFDLDDAMDLLYQIKDVLDGSDELPSVQPKSEERTAESAQNVPNDELISKKTAIDQLHQSYNLLDAERRIEDLPSAQPEPHYDEWCDDCKEYDKKKHSCPRWNRVIRESLKDAQPAEIIRCKDCVKCQYDALFDQRWCNGREVREDFYCADAERRTDG